jgi:hypothetical protein
MSTRISAVQPGFGLKSPKSHLETVSTVCGSGWVAVPKCEIAIDYEYDRFTHPLPRTVLTVSKRDVLTFEARPFSLESGTAQQDKHLLPAELKRKLSKS